MAKYPYYCPKCGTEAILRQRVTLTKRKCSYCGMPITTATIDRQAKARVMKSKTSTLIPVLLCFFMPHTAIFYSGVKANNNRWMLLGTGYFLSLMFAMDMNERSMQEKSEPSIFFNLLIPVQIASAFAIRFKCIKQLVIMFSYFRFFIHSLCRD
jgi:hypothetical protein